MRKTVNAVAGVAEGPRVSNVIIPMDRAEVDRPTTDRHR